MRRRMRRHPANVHTVSLPSKRRKGMPAALDDADIDAIVAFLGTLTDAPFEDRARRKLQAQAARRRVMMTALPSPASP